MSEQYEPSYYEIALTGRQVLAAFVILLVCLVAAFFSGVWVGRGGRGDEQRVAQAAAQQAPADEPKGRELSFFDEKPAAGAQGSSGAGGTAAAPIPSTPAPAQAPASAPSPAQDEERGADRTPAASSGPATPPPAAPAAPATTGGGAAPAASPPSRQTRQTPPARATKDRRAAASAEETNPSGSLTTGDVVIQVFSSGEEAKAREVLSLLEKHGFRAFLSPVVDGGRTLYRVRVGPFEHKSEAQAVAEKLHSSLNLETWITQ